MDKQTVPNPLSIEEIKAQLSVIKQSRLSRIELLQLQDFFNVTSKEAVMQYVNGKTKNRLLNTCFIIKANEIIDNRKSKQHGRHN